VTALPNRDRRAERRSATRREILDAAWEIARRDGLASLTLREVAARVGMRPPSLYSHFDSKSAVYDAMFGQAWADLIATFEALGPALDNPRRELLREAETFFDFAVADLARHQLMNQATIPDFRPSEEAYAHSLDAYERMRAALRGIGIRSNADLDLWTALLSGAVNQQLANDPEGNRWRRQLPRLVDMYCDETGIAGPALRGKK
jgi:AcrR family transcriptional regulator